MDFQKQFPLSSALRITTIRRLAACMACLAGLSLLLASCATRKKAAAVRPAPEFLERPPLDRAHTGICVYDPAAKKFLYRYQDEKYFVPASNAKLFSLYAGMKYLGDSLPAIGYFGTDSVLYLLPTGDPSFLHPDFSDQPLFRFLKEDRRQLILLEGNWKDKPWGEGWSWDDYNDDYMAERSPLPVYGNLVRWIQEYQPASAQDSLYPPAPSIYSIPEVNWKMRFSTDTGSKHFAVQRKFSANEFEVTQGPEKKKEQDLPFITEGLRAATELLKDTLGRTLAILDPASLPRRTRLAIQHAKFSLIHSRPADSLFRPMMFRSDNFYAEQTLLMVSQQLLGYMNDAAVIDTLLKTDLAGLPQKPRWVDGSGLSRYNLFSPQDFVWLLDTLQQRFGIGRMKDLLPTGGNGTLGNYFRMDSSYIYAKTGSLSHVIALSGYLITRKDRLLIFSVLVNNYQGRSGDIRRELEHFLHDIRENE